MIDGRIAVSVAKDIADLIPTFMMNRAREVETLQTLLAAGDMEKMDQIGHRMRGVGTPYGFEKISALGKQIQDGAKADDRLGLGKCIHEYADYLERVQVVYE